MRSHPASLDSDTPRLGRRGFLLGIAALAGLSGCTTVEKAIDDTRRAISAVTDVPQAIDRQKEIESIYRLGPEIYRAMTENTVALCGQDRSGVTLAGFAVIVQRIGPDNKKYRALLTNRHVIEKIRSSGSPAIGVLPIEQEPQDVAYQFDTAFGVNTNANWNSIAKIAIRDFVLDEQVDLAGAAYASGGQQLIRQKIREIDRDTRELVPGSIILTLSRTEGYRQGYIGVRPQSGSVVDSRAARDLGAGQTPTTLFAIEGSSGSPVFRLDQPENPTKVLLNGLVTTGQSGNGANIVTAAAMDDFLARKANEINARVAPRQQNKK